jgi:hypothetical protein
MADLDPGILLSGVTTTHPTLLDNPMDDQVKAAQIQAIGSENQLRGAQTQAAQLQNQVTQMNMKNAQGWATAGQAAQRSLTGAPAAPQPGAAPGAAPTPGATASAAPSGNTDSSSANTSPAVTPGSITLPKGAASVDQAHDWWLDSDGSPLSHANGPLQTPSGKLNTASADFIDAQSNAALSNGATPAYVAQQRAAAKDAALKLDTDYADMYDKYSKARESSQLAALHNNELVQARANSAADIAYEITKSPDAPGTAAVLSSIRAPVYGTLLSGVNGALTKSGQQPVSTLGDPRALPYLQNLASNSQERISQAQAGATITKTVADTDQAIQGALSSKIGAAVSQGHLEQEAGTALQDSSVNAARAAGIVRQANQVQSLDGYIDQLRSSLTPEQRSGQVALSKLPATVQQLAQNKGLVTKDASGQPSVQLPALIKAANEQMSLLDATVQTNEGVKGGMGSDARAQMQKESAGELKLTDNDATWQAKMNIRNNYRSGAQDVAGTILDTSNARTGAIIDGANRGSGANLNKNDFVVPKPTNAPTPFPGQTPAAKAPDLSKTPVGTVRGGFVQIGADPTKPSSWVKQQ